MKNTWIKILCLMVALMAVLTFVACDSDDDELDLGGGETSTAEGTSAADGEGDGDGEDNGGSEEKKCNGDDIHDWGKWQWTEATCETPKTGTRECTTCGWVETKTQGEGGAGHAWDNYQPAAGGKQRTCSACGKLDKVSYTNVAANASNISIVGAYGSGSTGVLTDGKWTIPFIIAPNGGPVTITFEFATPVDIDQISFLASSGAGSYQITATLSNGEEKILGTAGGGGQAKWGDTNGPVGTMDQSGSAQHIPLAETVKDVTTLTFASPSSANGTDAIGEIAIYTDPSKQTEE